MYFKDEGAIFSLSGRSLKLVEKFAYLACDISSAESDVNIHLLKAYNASNRLLILSKFDFSDKIKRNFLQVVAVSVILYGCTTRTPREPKKARCELWKNATYYFG